MKSGAMFRMVLAMGVVLPAVAVGVPSTADACGTAVYREIDTNAQLVAQAEQALSDGNFQKAASKAVQAYPALKIVKTGTLPLADRALRILALASVRADGGIAANGFRGKAAADRTTNLEWSVATLRSLNAARENNPSYQTDLGEALAKLPAYHAEAQKVLGELAAKDLLTSAEGYAALARLRAEGGDAAARDEAVKRCEAMSKTPAVCVVPAAVAAANAGQT
jgi:hypothetical protein